MNKTYHYSTLKAFNNELYTTLLHDHHIISDTLKELETPNQIYQGYFAKKDRMMYFIDSETMKELPIRILTTQEEKEGKNVVYVVTKSKTFRIIPFKNHTFKQLIDTIADFEHTNPLDWKLYKITCLASYCSRTFLRISTNPSFGKDSMKGVLGLLTEQVKVVKPRSIPGVLKELTPEGELVLNEVSGIKKEIRDLVQEIILQLGDGSVTYSNGALKSQSHHTKDKYDVHGLSVTAMYNRLGDYKDGEEEFFDNQFANNSAIKDRLFPLLFSGILNEKFDTNFDVLQEVSKNKDEIIKVLKSLEYYKKNWRAELKSYDNPHNLVKGRHKQTLNVLFDFINLYAESQEEHAMLCEELLKRSHAYQLMMLGGTKSFEETPMQTTTITTSPQMQLNIPSSVGYEGVEAGVVVEDLKDVQIRSVAEMEDGVKYYADQLKFDVDKAKKYGDVLEIKSGVFIKN